MSLLHMSSVSKSLGLVSRVRLAQSLTPALRFKCDMPSGRVTQDLIQKAKERQHLDGIDKKLSLPKMVQSFTPIKPQHFNSKGSEVLGDVYMSHPAWTREQLDGVEITHLAATSMAQRLSLASVQTLRFFYDLFTGYTLGRKHERMMLRRIVVLETVAGIPGMVGAVVRHFRSLRTMNRDYGWIHSLLEEAENERMHLMIAMTLRNASFPLRAVVFAAQVFFVPVYGIAYVLSPKFCHSFVGYLEEEAVKTYTKVVELIDAGKLPGFETLAPPAARDYFCLPDKATMRDVILAIRADEGHHRELNHTLAQLSKKDVNPFPCGF
ncbi:MAG: uncharacterized protein KVP18_002008 [Porospora cf. gigantea A]|uniref:uncharacterized protein n=1 Tax=Porospora cf. gigantea A TaxID=2853593 RepID=UPI00355A4807|nr:MAG: hypothetical protein KVP18_002008 [Porospora cf. gigantea A]